MGIRWDTDPPLAVFESSTLEIEIFLQVYAEYDPETSIAGIRQGINSIDDGTLQNGRMTEQIFREWLAIMFAGCTDEESNCGVSVLMDTVTLLKKEQYYQTSYNAQADDTYYSPSFSPAYNPSYQT